MDWLATEGIRFTMHCINGLHTFAHSADGQDGFSLNYAGVFTGVQGPCLIAEDRLTLPEMMKSVATNRFVGKWHIGMTFRTEEATGVRTARRDIGRAGRVLQQACRDRRFLRKSKEVL